MNLQTSQERLIRQQAERIDLLEEELRQAREKLPQAAIFPRQWKLSPSQSRFLGALAAAPNGFLGYSKIEEILILWAHESSNPRSTVSVQIHKMRRLLDQHNIHLLTRWGTGIELPPASRVIVKAAMEVPA